MSNKDRFKIFGTCDICHEEVIEQDCFRLVNDLLYCPECYENMVHEGRLDLDRRWPCENERGADPLWSLTYT